MKRKQVPETDRRRPETANELRIILDRFTNDLGQQRHAHRSVQRYVAVAVHPSARSLRRRRTQLVLSQEGQEVTQSGSHVCSDASPWPETLMPRQMRLTNKRVSPHTLRHATAMAMLPSGVALEVIALWLGHKNPATTHLYVEADLAMKEKALRRVRAPKTRELRFRPTDTLLRFLAGV